MTIRIRIHHESLSEKRGHEVSFKTNGNSRILKGVLMDPFFQISYLFLSLSLCILSFYIFYHPKGYSCPFLGEKGAWNPKISM